MNTMSFTKIVRSTVAVIFILGTVLGPIPQQVSAQETLPWRDKFDGALADGWYWVREAPAKWNLTENPGFLRIYTSPYATGGENLLLRPVEQEDFTIETYQISFTPDSNFQFAGLVIWQDADNFLQLGRAYCYIEENPCVGNGIYFDFVSGGAFTGSNFGTSSAVVGNPSEIYLRLVHQGNYAFAYYSYNGSTWTFMGGHTLPEGFAINGIGLTSSQDYFSGTSIPADFDYFELTEGPFLSVILDFWEQEGSDVDAFIDQRIADFAAANPDIAIVRTHYENEDLKNQFLDTSQAGAAPEVVRVPGDFAGSFVQANTLAPVDDLFDQTFRDQFLPGALELAVVRGTLWGVPDNYGNHLMLMYNKSKIADPPATFEELIDTALDLTTGEIQGFAYNEKEPYWGAGFFGAFGGWPLNANDQPQFNNQAFIDYLTYVAQLKADGVIPPECDYSCADSLFKEGKAAMIINGDWALWDYVNALGGNLGVAPVPPIKGRTYTEMTSGKYFMTSSGAAEDPAKKEAVQKFIAYMTSANVQREWLDQYKRLPSNAMVAQDEIITSNWILAGSMAALANGRGMPAAPEMSCAWGAWRPVLEDVMDGTMTPETAAAAAQKFADDCVAAMSNGPGPTNIVAYPQEDRVQALNWLMGSPITLTINGTDYTDSQYVNNVAPWDPFTSFAEFFFSGSHDLVPGDTVTITGDSGSNTYQVVDLEITSVDPDTDTVYGTAPAGVYVEVLCDVPCNIRRHVQADGTGHWSTNLSVPPEVPDEGNNWPTTYDIRGGEWFGAQQWNEQGNGVSVAFHLSNPRIDVHPQYDLVYGWEWPLDTELTLTIDGEMVATTTMTPTPWDPNSYWADFPLNGFDLLPGQEVTISYDNGTVHKTYKVGDPKLTNIDIQADKISGTGTPGTWLEVWANDPEGGGVRYKTIDNSGNWTVDFSTPSDPSDTQRPVDLKPGTYGTAYETNGFGDMTWANDWIAYQYDRCPTDEVCIRWFVGLGTGSDLSQLPTQLKVVEDFNASHPGIHLTLEVYPNDQARGILAQQIADGNPPDIVGPVGWGGSNSFHDQWLDLNPLISSTGYDTGIFDPQLYAMYQTDLGQEGLPFAVYPSVIYYNPALFDAALVNYPPAQYGEQYEMPDGGMIDWNWDTVAEVSKLLTMDANGKNSTEDGFDPNDIVQYGFSFGWQSGPNHSGSYWDSGTMLEGSGPYAAKAPTAWKDAWRWIYDGIWGAQPYYPGGEADNSFGGNGFNAGKIAMVESPSWYLCCNSDLTGSGGTFQFAPMPVYNGEVAGRIDADTFRILKGSPHPEEAFEVLTYLVGPEGVDTLLIGSEEIAPAYSAVSALKGKQGEFVAAQSAQLPFITPGSWAVLLEGLNYPDVPSAEAWMPNYDDAWNRGIEFRDMLYWNGSTNLGREIYCYEQDLSAIYNGQPRPDCRYPTIGVRANSDQVEGWDWKYGDKVTLIIDDPDTGTFPDYTATLTVGWAPWDTDHTQTYVIFNLDQSYDIETGDVVSLSNGTITKTTTVTDLSFTEINIDTDIVTGIATKNPEISVWACDSTGCHNRYISAVGGVWAANFAVPGSQPDEVVVNIIANTWVDSQQVDEDGDRTMFGQTVPSFVVFPEWERFDALNWPAGRLVTITVDGKSECSESPVSPGNFFNGSFGENCNIETGDVVTFSDGDTTLTHIVKKLGITEVNAEADTVSGTADTGAVVTVWPHATGQQIQVTAEDDSWQVDFTDTFDIKPNDCGRSQIVDDMGLATAVDWCAPNPRVEVHPQYDELNARGWPKGTELTLTISGYDGEFHATMDQAPWNPGDPNDIIAIFPLEGFDLQPGQDIFIIGGGLSREFTIPDPQVLSINLEENTISGTATPGRRVQVCANVPGYCISRWATADSSTGNWEVDFTTPSDPADTQEPYTLQLGSNGWAYEESEFGDQTWANDWHVPNPRITASITDDWFRVEDFPPNASIVIDIYESYYGNLYWHGTRTTDGNGYAFWANWETGENLDLKPGMHLVVSDEAGTVTKDIVLERLLLFTVDTDADFLAGSAPENRHVWVGAGNENYGCSMDVTSSYDGPDGSDVGTWSADFTTQSCDVVPGMWYAAQVFDEDSDATEANPGFPRGSHDYDGGDVLSSSCNAGGWTFDPDDQSRPVQVRILSDGEVVGEPVTDGGEDRGFHIGLWGVIESYVPHEIKVEAYDEESGSWYTLENSPKTLTCRTYDIYSYNPLTGTTKQISNLRDKDEYDPTWSPNGKQVAHDVVTSDSHAIYITDVKTGVSSMLVDVGNDADWSPNGKWIVFDKRWMGAPNLYIVPPSGGIPMLVKENAVRADWGPNSKRLVFEGTDGSIKTAPVDGGKGGETTIAPVGLDPAWSPDGKWIAYVNDGEIWKRQVNALGVTLGDPIQVTNLGNDLGSPTWSADSLTIVFNSGMMGGDWDLWSIPAAGGEPTWLTGAPGTGDVGPEYAKNGSAIAYAGVSPDGQAERVWVSAYTYDPPVETFGLGEHLYHFDSTWEGGSEVTEDVTFNINYSAPSYEGYALLRPNSVLAGKGCPQVNALLPDQPTRFLVGYVTDYEMTLAEAGTFFSNLSTSAVWDFGNPVELAHHEIVPWNSTDAWLQYVCTFTQR